MNAMLLPMPVQTWMGSRDYAAEADLLRKLRGGLGWSQEDTARRLGVKLRAYARWEAGNRCQLAALELLERIAAEQAPPAGKRKRSA